VVSETAGSMQPVCLSVSPSVCPFLINSVPPEQERSLRLTSAKRDENQCLSREELLKRTHSVRERRKVPSFPLAPTMAVGQQRQLQISSSSQLFGLFGVTQMSRR